METLPKGYRHLTDRERFQIYTLKRSGESNARKQLGRDRATTGLTRNAGWRGYRQAHRMATERRSAARPRKMTPVARSRGKAGSAVESGADLGTPAP